MKFKCFTIKRTIFHVRSDIEDYSGSSILAKYDKYKFMHVEKRKLWRWAATEESHPGLCSRFNSVKKRKFKMRVINAATMVPPTLLATLATVNLFNNSE